MVKAALAIAALAAGSASAAPTRGNPLIDALAHCLTIRSDAERLACTDVAAARLVEAERTRDVVVVTRDEVKKTKRSLFGLTLDENAVFAGREAPADRIDTLTTTLVAASPSGGDRWSLTLAEGGRWRTTEPWLNADPKSGMTVDIRRGALGSYMLRAKGSASVRVMRVN